MFKKDTALRAHKRMTNAVLHNWSGTKRYRYINYSYWCFKEFVMFCKDFTIQEKEALVDEAFGIYCTAIQKAQEEE